MKEHPIIFTSDNPKLILEGRKTQTRRLIVFHHSCAGHSPNEWRFDGFNPNGDAIFDSKIEPGERIIIGSYGVAGDRLWVRESFWNYNEPNHWRGSITYRCETPGLTELNGRKVKWRPSIHMPRWASRVTLEIVRVRVERLQDISEEDARAEGINGIYPAGSDELTYINGPGGYHWLWDSLHGKGAWDKNPWVWVIEFKKVRPVSMGDKQPRSDEKNEKLRTESESRATGEMSCLQPKKE